MKQKLKVKPVAVSIALVLFILGTILIISLSRGSSPAFNYVITNTNVLAASFKVTHGTNHVVYYPDRLRWECDQLLKRAGFRAVNNSQRLGHRTSKPCDTIWVICTYHTLLTQPVDLRARIVNAQGRTKIATSTGGSSDAVRRVTISPWSLTRGIETNSGSTIYIEDKAHGLELLSIQLP